MEKALTFWKKLPQISMCLRSLTMFYQTTEWKKKASRHNHTFLALLWMHKIKANQLALFHNDKNEGNVKNSSVKYTPCVLFRLIRQTCVYHSIVPQLFPIPHLYHTPLFPALPVSLNGTSAQNIVLQQTLLFSTSCWASSYSLLQLVTRGPHVCIQPPQAIHRKKCTKMIKKINIYKKC